MRPFNLGALLTDQIYGILCCLTSIVEGGVVCKLRRALEADIRTDSEDSTCAEVGRQTGCPKLEVRGAHSFLIYQKI